MIVPTNGNSDAAAAQPTSIGSAIRRLASAYVQYTSASQITTRNRIIKFAARLSPLLLMPKTAGRSIKEARVVVSDQTFAIEDRAPASEEDPTEQVTDAEENQDHHRDDQRNYADHRQKAGVVSRVVHGSGLAQSLNARSRRSPESRSATR